MLFSENQRYELSDWVKIKKEQINCNENCETDYRDEQKNTDSDKHLNCDWERIEF